MARPFTFTCIHQRGRMTVRPTDIDPRRQRHVEGKRIEFEGGRYQTDDIERIEYIRAHEWYGTRVFETPDQAALDPRKVFAEDAAEQPQPVAAEPAKPAAPAEFADASPDEIAEALRLLRAAKAQADAKDAAEAEPPAPDDKLDPAELERGEDGFYHCLEPGCSKSSANKAAILGHMKSHRKSA
ncbi:MAG TPA: hypothetical protein VFK80_06100 [Limnochordia bacterium]|nr:hypothetical protein [Limnochordia bacterium]